MGHIRLYGALIAALIVWAPILIAAAGTITGQIRDRSGAVIPDADVVLMTADRTTVATTRSDAEGKFRLTAPGAGSYLLLVRAVAFDDAPRAVVVVGSTDPEPLEIVLDVARLGEQVSVTASPGDVVDLRLAGQPVNVVDSTKIDTRVRTVVAQAIEGEAGVQLQRTSPTMAGVFIAA